MADLNELPLPSLFERLTRDGGARRLIELARDEDLGPERRDLTSEALISPDQNGRAVIAARASGVIAGLAATPMIIDVFAPQCQVLTRLEDGSRIESSATIAELRGPLREILAVERSLLNILSRLSGVATAMSSLVDRARDAAGEAKTPRIYDTRKTTPGMRALEKYAVRCGGGFCHRLGLYDAVLIKDNHLAHIRRASLAERITEAASLVKEAGPVDFIEIEADSLDEVEKILTLDPGVIDIVLLDNMSPEELRQAVSMRDASRARPLLEASGGVTSETVDQIALAGVDRISAGGPTHSPAAMDLGLDML